MSGGQPLGTPATRFLLKLALFLAPLATAWGYVEYRLHHAPVPLVRKRAILEDLGARARILVLGSSIEFEDVAPREFDCLGINAASEAQTLFLDSEIARLYVPEMPRLRLVMQGVPYGVFEGQLGDTYLSQYVYAYHHYLGTRLDGGVSFWDAKTFSLIATFGQDLALAEILSNFSWDLAAGIDQQGWKATDAKIDLNSEALAGWFVNSFQDYLKPEHIPENKQALEGMLTMLRERGITPVLISSPMAPILVQFAKPDRVERTRALIAEVQARFGVAFHDYSTDPRFTVEDFANFDHLNRAGALKYSRILNEEIIRPLGVCSDRRV